MKDAIILIPSYEPDQNLINVVDSLTDNNFPILVVNDGSNASFDALFDKIKDKVTYLTYQENHGKGYALKYGFKYILESLPDIKYVITADGDGQHSIEDINKVYDSLCDTNNIVLGMRDFDVDVPPKSKFGNFYSRFNRSWVTKEYLPDDQCGLRGFPTRYLSYLIKIKGDRYDYEMSQIMRLQMMRVDIVTIPIKTIYEGGKNSTTHFAPFKDTVRIHSLIALHGLTSIITSLILISLIVLAFHYTSLPTYAPIYISYLATTLLYLVIVNIAYPVRNRWRSIGIELLSTGLEMLIAHFLLWLTIDIFQWNYIAVTPFAIVIASLINIPLALFLDLAKKSIKKQKQE